MNHLARAKKEIATRDVAYANGSYEKDMEQAALLNEAKTILK